jgi:hypothetical protein
MGAIKCIFLVDSGPGAPVKRRWDHPGRMVIPLARHPLRFSLLPGSEPRQCFLSGARHLPGAPLPEPGITRLRVMSRITSEGVTPPSQLL